MSARVVPRLVLVGDPEHAVAGYARQLADVLAEVPADVLAGVPVTGVEAGAGDAAHLHFTDRLYARSPTAAADRVERLARRCPVTVTLHDVPQPSDGEARVARVACYARVVAAARGVVCNSEHELALLHEAGIDVAVPATVVPLPVLRRPTAPVARPDAEPEAAVFGFFYPGKGHDAVATALAGLAAGRPSLRLDLAVLGRASPGHQHDLDALVEYAGSIGVPVRVTGYLPETVVDERLRRTGVPVVAHEHVSASGSLNSWLAAGRRPLLRESRYAREMAALRPGTCTTYHPRDLAQAIRTARDEPGSTWLDERAVLGPGLGEVADAYVRWWTRDVSW